ncbi:MAG: ABC-F family ATP-binding cassette domain-containing protein [Lachnospiraceae bacterium]|nr:ABC-F family ATP-binding cassette domain-containing protein [Lachnospiraceae bacterium]
MILTVSNIDKAFGENVVLSGVSFLVNEHEKVALIGRNGAGKSTLFKIIMGELSADAGTVTLAKDARIGYLSQHQDLTGDATVYEEVNAVKAHVWDLEARMRTLEENMKHAEGDALDAMYREYASVSQEFERLDGYAAHSEVIGVLRGLGFDESSWDKRTNVLSGGQKTRVALAKLLLEAPDIILLDEPTNHLDLNSVAWLETFLANYKGAVLIVSHDRYFLNKIVTHVVEIDHNKSMDFPGNYDAFAEKKAMVREAQRRAYEKQQAEIHHQEEVIAKLRSFGREKQIKRAESRVKMLDKMERLDRPVEEERGMTIKLSPRFTSGNDVLTLTGLAKSYDTQTLFTNISLLVKRGEKVALLGDNGTGKTTLLKIIRGLVTPDAGEVRYGARVNVGYYDQEQHNFTETNTLFQEISDAYPSMTNTEVRNTLAAFCFTGDDVFAPVSTLSGGERGRLSLAKLMLSEANFLLLDEPTNHLDILGREILEDAIRAYEGTVFYVSHDRYFVNRTATRVLELTRGAILSYEGNYDDYLAFKERKEAAVFGAPVSGGNNSYATSILTPVGNAVAKSSAPSAASTENKSDWLEQKELQAQQRKLKNRISSLETEIEKLETRIAEIDELMVSPEICTNSLRLNELTTERNEAEEKLLEAMTEWEEITG